LRKHGLFRRKLYDILKEGKDWWNEIGDIVGLHDICSQKEITELTKRYSELDDLEKSFFYENEVVDTRNI
jgi:hypothetical protein